MDSTYVVQRAAEQPALDGNWGAPAWRSANVVRVDRFMSAPKVSDHQPDTRAKVMYTDAGLFVFFKVNDRYVVSRHAGFQSAVSQDSCVEFFVQPKAGQGYFNFELNAGGALLLYYIEDPTRLPTGFGKYTKLPPDVDALIPRYHSFEPVPCDPRPSAPDTRRPPLASEVAGPLEWRVEYFIPFTVLERYVGPLGPVAGQTWRANFFKCADASSHPHWATWAPLDPDFAGGFHRPDKFGVIHFAR